MTENDERRLARMLRQLSDLDRAIYIAIAKTPTPDLDEPIRKLSHLADSSRLWFGVAAGLALFGGPNGRRAAARGLLTVGLTSAAVNLGVKSVYPRQRPDRTGAGVPQGRHIEMPSTRSFPSGHSASGFAFAGSVGRDMPALALPLRFLAGAVAYSRVHSGVHYPSDALIGSIIGAGSSEVLSAWVLRRPPRPTTSLRTALCATSPPGRAQRQRLAHGRQHVGSALGVGPQRVERAGDGVVVPLAAQGGEALALLGPDLRVDTQRLSASRECPGATQGRRTTCDLWCGAVGHSAWRSATGLPGERPARP